MQAGEDDADIGIEILEGLMIPDLDPPSTGSQHELRTTAGRRRPLINLTRFLVNTYNDINTIEAERRVQLLARRYRYRIGETLNNRYTIVAQVGSGSFGQVTKARDFRATEHSEVAIKIYNFGPPFRSQADVEINLLTELRSKDPEDEYNIVRLLDTFEHMGHQSLVFECLSMNLYQYLKRTRYPDNSSRGFYGVSLNLVRQFAKQLLKTLDFLARTDIGVIHCDLKPENILLCDPSRSRIKLIDFGSSCRANQLVNTIVQSRFYRAPEVLLGMRYSFAIDVWSLGCILFEMHTGRTLCEGRRDDEQLSLISQLIGAVPVSMINRASPRARETYFERRGGDNDSWVLRQQVPANLGAGTNDVSLSPRLRVKLTTESSANYDLFEDLIKRMLSIDPDERITAATALNHSFFGEGEHKEMS